MLLEINNTKLPGCYKIIPAIHKDKRGSFIKTFHQGTFIKKRLNVNFSEEYYTYSKKSVLRGMHFQLPPKDLIKLVYCISGEVMDVVVDLRTGSPTYGKYEIFYLNSKNAPMVYIPKGLAHGFYVLSNNAIMAYKVSTVYSPKHDSGILWNSINIPWPNKKPILSQRDKRFMSFKEFNSPFTYEEK
ncbi:MAG TPA: dTDP-4-dehydrorhamnose 3,5-epimerase [Marinilabiliales bacterium]|nr:dTDP-4-dehydrorhamnose 3,5-epimerase [Marinilabiliales bacterium]